MKPTPALWRIYKGHVEWGAVDPDHPWVVLRLYGSTYGTHSHWSSWREAMLAVKYGEALRRFHG